MQRNTNQGRSELAPEGAGTTLGRCLVDGDVDSTSRARRSRRKAFGCSLAFETGLLAALFVVPLFTTVARPSIQKPQAVQFVWAGRIGAHPAVQPTPTVHNSFSTIHDAITFPIRAPIQHPPDVVENSSSPEPAGLSALIGQISSDAAIFRIQETLIPSSPPHEEVRKREEKHPLKLSEPVVAAQLIARIEPRYPMLAKLARREGTVVLHAIISRDGAITSLEVVRGDPLLVGAALDAVRQWHYRPTMLDGEPVEVETTITVVFRLQ